MNQTTIFDVMYPKYKITKPIRLIELFGGYGSQALALKYLGVKFEHWKLVEWAVKSIQAYKDIHFTDEKGIDIDATKDQLVECLYKYGISSNYNEPMTKEQISRLNEKQLKTIWNNIYQTHNLVNIQQVKGKDLQIVDTDKYDYIMTYSFPCQDLSLAGKGKGMSDTSTRSGMLWEVERILTECHELGTMPQILLMENVPQVHSQDNMKDFHKWQVRLEELGYHSYWQDLIATDYGIPQTRNRCFMISILGDYSYTFPQPIPLKLKLKDMLENNVDEKYYLSDKMKQYIFSEDDKYKVNKNSLKLNREIACSKTTREGNTRADTSDYIVETCLLKNKGKELTRFTDNANTIMARDYKGFGNQEMNAVIENKPKKIGSLYEKSQAGSIYSEEAICPTLTTESSANWNILLGEKIKIKNATKQGYLEATDRDGIDLLQPNSETRRGRVQKQTIQTLDTMGGEGHGVVVKPKVLGGIGEKKSNGGTQWYQQDIIYDDKVAISVTTDFNPYYKVETIGNYSPSNHNASRIVDSEYSAPTVMENHGTITATQTSDLRIRKLTPRECFRLMGVKDEDFDKVKKNQSDSSLYHLAGDSIVVNVIEAIIKELL